MKNKLNFCRLLHYDLVCFKGSMSNNVGDNLNQQNLLNYAAASIAN